MEKVQRNGSGYAKLKGLSELAVLGLRVPRYILLPFKRDATVQAQRQSLRELVERHQIPNLPGDRVGVTIRISIPGYPDRGIGFGGIHVLSIDKVIDNAWELFAKSNYDGKVFIMDSIDAIFSGTIVKREVDAFVEVVRGDLVPLAQGTAIEVESWYLNGNWRKEPSKSVERYFNEMDLKKMREVISQIPPFSYLEWSKAVNGIWYFYEIVHFTKE